jgi:hypothetical protein
MTAFFLGLFSISSWGICEQVNLITEPNSPFREIPVYDQGSSPSCFSYSSTLLINYFAMKKGYGQIAYPLWLAIQDSKNKNHDTLSGSNAYSAVENFKKQKFCSATVIQNAISEFAHKNHYPENKVFNLINSKGLFTEHDMAILRKCDVESLYQFFGNGHPLRSLTSADFFLKLIMPSCHPAPVPPMPKPTMTVPYTTSIAEQSINNKLSRLKIPIAIGFCSAALYDPNYPGLSTGKMSKTKVFGFDVTQSDRIPANCGNHSSVLVGQKVLPNGQGCGYLLRNSWGNGFTKATLGVKCLCRHKKTKQYVDDCSAATHNNGQWSVEACWYPSQGLKKSIYNLTTLE